MLGKSFPFPLLQRLPSYQKLLKSTFQNFQGTWSSDSLPYTAPQTSQDPQQMPASTDHYWDYYWHQEGREGCHYYYYYFLSQSLARNPTSQHSGEFSTEQTPISQFLFPREPDGVKRCREAGLLSSGSATRNYQIGAGLPLPSWASRIGYIWNKSWGEEVLTCQFRQ